MKLKSPTKIEVRNSEISGVGVFAKEDIKKGEILEECHAICIERKEEDIDNVLINYTYKWDDSPDNFIVVFGMGSIYNSSENSGVRYNVKVDINKELSFFQFTADRDISKNEELLLCYETHDMKLNKKLNKKVSNKIKSKNISLFLNSKIEVKDSELSGRGVFAKEDIKKGEILEECHHKVLEKKFNFLSRKTQEYVFAWPMIIDEKNTKSVSTVVFGFGSIFNHQKDNNANWILDTCRDVFTFYARKNIKKGEEICTNYGDGYLKNLLIKMK